MKIRNIILLILMITALGACESLITTIPDSKLPKIESQLVVQCFISPQSPRINVVVTESVPLFGETTGSESVIFNAVVKISDGTKEVTIPFDTESLLYTVERAAFPIVAGKTYTLSVSDGKRSVSAKCTVPGKNVAVKTYTIDTTFNANEFNPDSAITVKMNWQDIVADTNYYRVRASLDLEYSIPAGTSVEEFKEMRIRNRFNFNWDETIGRNDYVSDANLDGTLFTSPIGRCRLPGVIVYDFGNDRKFTIYPKSKIIMITMDVYNTDVNYFKYHRSLELRRDLDNPFTEPALIYTNVKGGLGCFAAYNSGQVVYRPQ